VTHERDIAAYASRILFFRDGRLLSDEPRAVPEDAVSALAALPAGEEALA
jgi:putative ABC transport system ATP-binding protein